MPIAAHLVHHFTPLRSGIQDCYTVVRTGFLTSLTPPVVASQTHILLPSPPTGFWTPPPLILSAYVYPPFPVPFTLPSLLRQQGPLKCWYPTGTQHGVTTLRTPMWIFTAVKTSSQIHEYYYNKWHYEVWKQVTELFWTYQWVLPEHWFNVLQPQNSFCVEINMFLGERSHIHQLYHLMYHSCYLSVHLLHECGVGIYHESTHLHQFLCSFGHW